MITVGNKNISEIYVGNKRVEEVYVGEKKVFPEEVLLFFYYNSGALYPVKNKTVQPSKTIWEDKLAVWNNTIIGIHSNRGITLYNAECQKIKNNKSYYFSTFLGGDKEHIILYNNTGVSVLNKELEQVKSFNTYGNYGSNGSIQKIWLQGRSVLVSTSYNKLFYIPNFLEDTMIELTDKVAANDNSTKYALFSSGILRAYNGRWNIYNFSGEVEASLQGPSDYMQLLYEDGDYLYIGSGYKIIKLHKRTLIKTEIPTTWNTGYIPYNDYHTGRYRYIYGGDYQLLKLDVTTGSKELVLRNNNVRYVLY